MKRTNLTLISLFLAFSLFAQYTNEIAPGIILTIEDDGYTIHYEPQDEFYLAQDTIENDNSTDSVFSYIENIIIDYDLLEEGGYPELPYLSYAFQLPDDADNIIVSYKINETEKYVLPYKYIPCQFLLEEDTICDLQYDTTYYFSDGSEFYDNFYTLSNIYHFLGTTGINLNFYPFTYNPKDNYLNMVTSADIHIKFDGSSLIELVDKYRSGVHYNDAMIFYDTYDSMSYEGMTDAKGNYVIITKKDYVDKLASFASYKNSLGYNTRIYSTEYIGGNSVKDIRGFIKGLYDDRDSIPRFVLLVGNANDIPYSAGTPYVTNSGDGCDPITDIFYACLEYNTIAHENGDNLYPELYLGRWPVNNSDDLDHIIQKTMDTEQALATKSRTDLKVALFSGIETDGKWRKRKRKSKRWYKQNEKVVNKVFNPQNYNYRSYNGWDGFNAHDIYREAEDDSLYMFIYRGHGGSTAIGSPYNLTSSLLSNFNNSNYRYQPFGFGFGCLLNNYAYINNSNEYSCLGKGWICEENGGVSFFGASTISYNIPNKNSQKKIFYMLKNNCNYTLAQMTVIGMCHYYGGSLEWWKRRQIKKYDLFGDPSLYIYGCNSTGTAANYIKSQNTDTTKSSTFSNNIDISLLESGIISIQVPSDNLDGCLYMYSSSGNLIKTIDIKSTYTYINTQNIPEGIYILTYYGVDIPYLSEKIIIKH